MTDYDILQSLNMYMVESGQHLYEQSVLEVYDGWQRDTGLTATNPHMASFLLEMIDSAKDTEPELLRELVQNDVDIKRERDYGEGTVS